MPSKTHHVLRSYLYLRGCTTCQGPLRHMVLVLQSVSFWGLASAACCLGRGPGISLGTSWWQC